MPVHTAARASARLEPRPGGEPVPLGATFAATYDDKLEAIAVVPVGDRRSTLRADLVRGRSRTSSPARSSSPRVSLRNPFVAEFVWAAENLLGRA